MRASELVEELETLINDHGNLHVYLSGSMGITNRTSYEDQESTVYVSNTIMIHSSGDQKVYDESEQHKLTKRRKPNTEKKKAKKKR